MKKNRLVECDIFFNPFSFLIVIFIQKLNDHVSSDDAVNAALKRKGHFTKAPKNSCGCKHCAMSDMRRVSVGDFAHYLKRDEAFYQQKCSGKNCPHGEASKSWPIKKQCGEKWQAYWCKFGSTKECRIYFCVDCGQERLDIESNRNIDGGRTSCSRRNNVKKL